LRNKQQCLIENQEIDETEFLVDGGSYLTVPARHELTGQFNYSERYYAEKWFRPASMRVNRFHSYW